MTQEPKPIKAYRAIDLIDLVAIAKNALMLLEDVQTGLNRPNIENSLSIELKQQLDDMLKDPLIKQFLALDADLDSNPVEVILENSLKFKPKDQREEEVLAACDGTVDANYNLTINVTGQLADYIKMTEEADLKLNSVQRILRESEFKTENFWAHLWITDYLAEARNRLEPLLANTKRVKS